MLPYTASHKLNVICGVIRTAKECASFNRVCINASEDSWTGTNPTSHVFFDRLFKSFIEQEPLSANEKQPGKCKLNVCKSKLKQSAADFNTFCSALKHFSGCKLRGVIMNNAFSMAIPKYHGKHDFISYDSKYFCLNRWLHNHASTVLQNHPKFRNMHPEAKALLLVLLKNIVPWHRPLMLIWKTIFMASKFSSWNSPHVPSLSLQYPLFRHLSFAQKLCPPLKLPLTHHHSHPKRTTQQERVCKKVGPS